MEIYFYCSYSHSQRGFFLTFFDGQQLRPAQMQRAPQAVYDFFTYARFDFLWREFAASPSSGMPLNRTGAFLGVREIKGTLADGRSAVANAAFVGNAGEIAWIRRSALTMLGNYPEFESDLISWLRVGGECGYEINASAFNSWFMRCRESSLLVKHMKNGDEALRLLGHMADMSQPSSEPELIRLASMVNPWEFDRAYFGSGPQWDAKPEGVVMTDEFGRIFKRKGGLWNMETEVR